MTSSSTKERYLEDRNYCCLVQKIYLAKTQNIAFSEQGIANCFHFQNDFQNYQLQVFIYCLLYSNLCLGMQADKACVISFQFLATMPRAGSPTTVVISCEEDKSLWESALKNGISLVNAEFILTGILRQEIDINSYPFSVFTSPEHNMLKGSF